MTTRTESWYRERPWAKEGFTPSAWKRRHRAAINMAIQSLGDARVRGMSPAEIVAHVRAKSVTAPGAIFAVALRQSPDHEEQTGGPGPYVHRLKEAAKLAEAGAEGEEHGPHLPPAYGKH